MDFKLCEQSFTRVINLFPQPIVVFNQDGEIVCSNSLFNHEIRDSLEGDNLFSIINTEEMLTNLSQGGYYFKDLKLNRDKMYTASLYPLESNQFILIFNIHPTTQFASISRQYATQIFNDINSGLIVIDPYSRVIEINRMACAILGIEKNEIIGKTFWEAFPDIPEENYIVSRSLINGVTETNKAFSWTSGGKSFELLLDSHLLYDSAGGLAGAYVIFKDVSDLRSIDEKIQRSDRLSMIGQIAAGTAHEIRNPLTSIRGFLQILGQSLESSGFEKEKGYVDLMLVEIKRINSLVDQFLLLSKPRDVQYKLVDLNEVLAEILPIIQNEAILYNVEVVNKTEGKLPKIIGDSELLKQVFLNICKNGVEAIGKNGTVTIDYEYKVREKKVMINIHDTGSGIPPYILDRIFDPFFTTKEEGTGLGLSVCQRIIQDLGGSIRVNSKGFGTVFHIILPYLK